MGDAIIGDDSMLDAAIASANVLALTASTVHVTGDPSILRGDIRPRKFVAGLLDGGLTADEQAALRAAARDAIDEWRDLGCPRPAPLDDALVRELLDWVAAESMPDAYAAMCLEEMDLAGTDPRRIRVDGDAGAIDVLVIGLGMSGLLAAVRLQQAGIPFEVVEKNDDAGGTWLENTYPGCRVDVPNHYYCYSFEPNVEFTEHFARQPELHAYFRDVMRRHGIEEHVRWRTEVERAEWDDDAQRWRVTTVEPDGTRTVRTANAIISAVGQLNRPYVPDLPHLDRFEGPVFHSARWDHGVDLRGKRVALIGAGASGFQIGPAIVDDVAELVVFQRTAQWMMPNPQYHEPVDAAARWAMRHLPGYARWYRFLLLWQATDKLTDTVRVDPEWPGLPLSANARSERLRNGIVRWIESQVGDDAELLAKVVPDYPPLGKRMLQDDGSWLACLGREHVELVRDPIDDVEAGAIVAGGTRHEVDVIVLATGFRANDFLFPMEVVGRGGVSLHDAWSDRPAAYVGITVPRFPNLFLLYGPGTNLAHAGSIIFHSECQMRYVGAALATLAAQGGGAIEPTADAFDEYVTRWQDELSHTVWAHPSVAHSWYKAPDGNVYVLSPWSLLDYWTMTAAPDPAAHATTPPRPARV